MEAHFESLAREPKERDPLKQIRKRLTYANVMSSLAVFLVLGGATAFAANQLGKKTVGAKQLKANAVTTAKIKSDAVTAKKIKKNAVTKEKIAAGAVDGSKIAAGAVGATQLAVGAVGATQLAVGAVGANQIGANAVGNTQTQFVKVFKGSVVPAAASEAVAPKIALGSVGPFQFYGKCFQVAGPKVQEKTYIELTNGEATLGSEDGAELPTNTKQEYLTPSTPEANRVMQDDSIAESNKATAVSNDEEFQARATDGTEITGLIGGTGAKQGNPVIGDGPFQPGDSCIVGAVAIFGS
jgi:hypothetical protein